MGRVKADVIQAICQDCHWVYEIYTLSIFDEGDWPMQCSGCRKVAWTGGKDQIFNIAINKFKTIYGDFFKNGLNSHANEFIRSFEKTCMPCACGGEFRVITPWVCPFCNSRSVAVDWDHVVRQDAMEFEVVKHVT
ncbi:MAG: hypothetical protein A2351_08245 [Omnitrophica bacterium RIFOXYB12_FULL_50_7]|nr:MAG: hypothetical protein A2351_08245 [Omnitrophica bacterium RIFOXYB12_FULL_50_7]